MKSLSSLRFLAAALVAISFSGCLQIERLVHLKKDGSGTIEEKLTMSAATVAQMKQMQSLGGDEAKKAGEFKLLDESKLKAQAADMGEGVTFVSAKPISGPEGEGYVATYAFTDISKVNLAQGPADISPGGGMKMKTNAAGEKPVTFAFAKGSPAKLTIQLPDEKAAAEEAGASAKAGEVDPAEAMQEAMLPMMTQMMKDMRMSVAIEVEGSITDTNATHKKGSRVTLMDVDFNALLAKPETLKSLMKKKNQSLSASKELLKGVDGVTFEANNPVTISFK